MVFSSLWLPRVWQLDAPWYDGGPCGQDTRAEHRADLCVGQDGEARVSVPAGPGSALREGALIILCLIISTVTIVYNLYNHNL